MKKVSSERMDWTAVKRVRGIEWWVWIRSHAHDAPHLGYEREISILISVMN